MAADGILAILTELSFRNRLAFVPGILNFGPENASLLVAAGSGPVAAICHGAMPDVRLRTSTDRDSGTSRSFRIEDSPGGLISGTLIDAPPNAENHARFLRTAFPVLVRNATTGVFDELTAWIDVPRTPEIVAEGRGNCVSANEIDGFVRESGCEIHAIFTYGTLCRGECREDVMRGDSLERVGLAELKGPGILRHSSGEYPCLVSPRPETGNDEVRRTPSVVGDLWIYRNLCEADVVAFSRLLHALEEIEGESLPTWSGLLSIATDAIASGASVLEAAQATRRRIEEARGKSLFRRTLMQADFEGASRLAWGYRYVGSQAGLLPIASGNWRLYAGRWNGSSVSNAGPASSAMTGRITETP